MTSLRRALAILAFLGLAIGAVVIVIIATSDRPNMTAALVIGPLICWSFIGTGLFAWLRRPENRTGMLMTAVGFAFFLGGLASADDSAIFSVGFAFGASAFGVLVHMLVAFPTGRLNTTLERGVVTAAYVITVPFALLAAVFRDTAAWSDCERCPENAFMIADRPGLADAITVAYLLSAVLGLLAAAFVIYRRWRASGPSQRRAYLPVATTAGAVVATQVVSLLGYATGLIEGDVEDVAGIAGLIAFASVPYGFLIGLLRSRLGGAGAVAELVSHLGAGDRPGLRDALAGALGDPDLELVYWARDQDRYVAGSGLPAELPEPGSGRAVTPVEHDGRPIAALVHAEELLEDAELVRAAGAAAALSLENERLAAELRARVEDVRASRARLVSAADDERRRLERDLHDGAQQRLVALSVNLRLARDELERDPAAAGELIDECREELSYATEELRELARGIHPAVLTDRGLSAAVQALASRATFPVEVDEMPSERLPAAVEAAAYFVVAEALTNVARYSGATYAQVRVARTNGLVTVDVADDGRGGADPAKGSGLRGLTDRLAALDGSLAVASPAGAGTRLHAEIPCGS